MKTIELYKYPDPKIEFKDLESPFSDESGAETILAIAYTMVPSHSMSTLVSKVFKNIAGTPTKEKFMMEFWKLARNSFYTDND